MELPAWFEGGGLAVLVAILVADLLVVTRRPHVPSMRECGIWVGVYVALALVYGGIIWVVGSPGVAGEFYAGWLTEYSLSVDNLFVFIIIMSTFTVPRRYQQEALMGGIIIALVLRGVFILLGAQIIERFVWVFYVFGAFLVYTAVNLVRSRGEQEEYHENVLVRRLRAVLPLSEDFHGAHLRVREGGRRVFTPMVVVLLALGSTDLLFALDSIPAIFGLTRDPFLVFSANLWALMGLRQLYFLLGGLLERLVYLQYGLAVILAFIGVKLVLQALHENSLPFLYGGEGVPWAPEVPIWLSLVVIVVVLVVATAASLLRTHGRPAPEADAEEPQG